MAAVLRNVREDDFIEYFIFPEIAEDCVNANEESEIKLKNLLSSIDSLIRKYTQQYIWHKDTFQLNPIANSLLRAEVDIDSGPVPPHLHGITHYGDNIEDEWFVVFLLLQLTREVPGLISRVVDSDGEFLLIEAADYLPSWANPDTCQQRVYMYQGAIHIIPPESGDDSKIPSINDAVAEIRREPHVTCANERIQQAINSRIKGYPEKIDELLHRTNVYVPVAVAALLKERPNLIAPAVLAFCNRDPIDMKACRAMKYFPPENRVMTNVTFTKYLYAMLVHHKFNPDQRVGWNMPLPTSENYKAHSLGVKLACGFEILVAQAKPNTNGQDSSFDVESDPGWFQYLNSLKNRGYFRDYLDGSKDYQQLKLKAQEYYITHREVMPCKASVGQEILTLLGNLHYDVEELKNQEANLPPSEDDKWLEISRQDLDDMLEQRYGKKHFTPVNSSSDPSAISSQLTRFLDQMSGLEGAEFPEGDLDSDTPPVRPKRGIKKKGKLAAAEETETSSPGSSNKINFDHEAFSCAVQNILDFVVPEDNWDLESEGSGMSSYEDEIEMDLDQLKSGEEKKKELASELKQYMDQMDKELATTAMGKSFEKTNSRTEANAAEGNSENFDDIEDFKPVDIDMNALKNILHSYEAQMGGSGPASNLLGPMGVHLESSET